jgi:alpha-glucosidase (family GH31 glycosyl hydrolase)
MRFLNLHSSTFTGARTFLSAAISGGRRRSDSLPIPHLDTATRSERGHSCPQQRVPTPFLYIALATAAFCLPIGVMAAVPIRFGGEPAELTLASVSEKTLRLQLIPLDEKGRPQPPAPSTVLVPFPATEKLRVRELAHERALHVGRFQVTLKPEPLTISVRRSDGKLVQELSFDDADGTNSVSFRTDAPVLGLGEGEQQFDRRGHDYPMRNGQAAPWLATHGATIPVPFLIGTDGWALFVHGPWGQFDLGEGKGRFLPSRASAGREPLELYVIGCAEPADALGEYLRLTGHPVMPPKWVLGYIQSHRTLAGPEEPLRIAQTFREKKLPCDALIYLGTGYCTNGWNTGHGSLDFNPNAFDHPAQQIQALHALNFKVVLHINHAPRNMFGASINEASDSPLHIRNYWARHRQDVALGVDGWWPDDGDELPIEARLARHRCYYEGPLQDHPDIRPWSLHRNGFAGAARYGGWLWSGDVESRWATLAAHVPVGLNYSLSVTPFWGTDTGGFIPTREFTGELYVRWFQFSAFNPLFRSHGRTWHLRLPWGWNTGETGPIESRDVTDRAELHNAEVEPICRKYLELRYRLLPYNYSLLREVCDSGLPPMRALWLHYPSDPEAVKLGDEYLWGRNLLVAPVVEKNAKSRRLYLPAGNWYDWWTGEKIAGGRWLDRPVDLATMPLYARAGAIVPLDPVRQYTEQPVSEPTTLLVYPGADGSFTLYDDDGASLDYLKDIASWTRVRWEDHRRVLTIEPDARSRMKPGPPRNFDVLLVSEGTRKTVEYLGRRIQVRFAPGQVTK